jgi:predicted PurR-regulated permease PerM
MVESIKRFFSNLTMRRFFVVLMICLLLFSIRDMLNLILLTFLIVYIMNSLQRFLTEKINKHIRISNKFMIVVLYLVLVTTITLAIINYMPKVFSQIKQLKDILIGLMNMPMPQDEVSRYIYKTLKDLNLQTYTKQGFEYVLRISNWGTTFTIAVILSFFFIFEQNRIKAFTARFRDSKISWLYEELAYFGEKFMKSFGKVIEAQLIIALCNTVFTVIGLWILGFPYLFALTIMVFLLSLIPVAGFLISLVPLSIIGYSIGGPWMIVYVIVMIMVLHFIEGYFLNPKLMSSKTNLPMFYTFIVLVFSQHYLGVWGLIVGIPIFVFVLDILNVDTSEKLPI